MAYNEMTLATERGIRSISASEWRSTLNMAGYYKEKQQSKALILTSKISRVNATP